MYKNERKKYIPPPTWNQLRMYDNIKKKMQINFDQLISELIIIPITRLKKIIFQIYFHSNFYFSTCNLFYLYKDGSRIPGKNNIVAQKVTYLKKRSSKIIFQIVATSLRVEPFVILFSLIYFKPIPILFFRL